MAPLRVWHRAGGFPSSSSTPPRGPARCSRIPERACEARRTPCCRPMARTRQAESRTQKQSRLCVISYHPSQEQCSCAVHPARHPTWGTPTAQPGKGAARGD
ncbi:hypothetical protein EI94DRAFT_1756473 [Lactarius quietus]|nr:hypothetical protein EI94DRAFT_1756473 [Lactarius quietus]